MLSSRDYDFRDVDLHALIRLSGELGEIGADLTAKRAHALVALAQLCDADKAVAGDKCLQKTTGVWEVVLASIQFVNTPENEQHRLIRYFSSNAPPDPVADWMLKSPATVCVARPQDCLSDAQWRASRHYLLTRKPSKIIEQITARVRSGGVSFSLELHRCDERPFERREARLLDIFLRGTGNSLHSSCADKPTAKARLFEPPALPPRLASVLTRFLKGESEKEVAKFLGVTHHTVHSYAKQLYRRLGVTSRSELLARFIHPSNSLHSSRSDGRQPL